MVGDGKNRKGRGSSGKMRANSGKVRARPELSVPLDSQKDNMADLVLSEPALKAEGMTTAAKNEELGLDSSEQPGTMTDLTEAVVMGEPKENINPMVSLIPLGNQSGVTQISGYSTERGAVAIDKSVSNQSKEGKCPWMDSEAAPWISEKPKKRGNDGKNKKFKNSYSTQPARMENKAEIFSPPFVGSYEAAGSSPRKNEELGLGFPKIHDPLFSDISSTPTVELVDRKGRNAEGSSFELGALSENKTSTVKDCAVTQPAATVTDVGCQDQIQGVEFVPLVLPEESKTDAAPGHTAVADKPNKKSDDGKSQKVKNNFPKKHILENKIDVTKIHVPMETTGDHRIEGLGYVDENRNITFTCPRTPPELMSKSAPLEAMESATCEKLPISPPQVVKEGDSFPDTLAESEQAAASAQISKLLVVDNCSKDGVSGQEGPKAPTAVMPCTNIGVALIFPAAIETVDSHGDNYCKSKGELAHPMKNEEEINGGHVVGKPESVHSDASEDLTEKTTVPAKGHFLPRAPEDHSLPGEVRVLEAYADRGNFPAYPVKKEKETEEGSVPAQIPDLLGDKTQKPSFCEDQNNECRDSRDSDSLNKGVDITLLPAKSKKDKLKEMSLACDITELEYASSATPDLQSDFLHGKVEDTPSGMVDELVVTAPKGLELPKPKDKILEAPLKRAEISEPVALGEGKKENKSRMTEPMKGYMRPTKSRGLTPLLPKSTIQERERSKQQKSIGTNQPLLGKCVCLWLLSQHQKG
nr:uncharacterized protein LOC111750588 [Loxodonta africana]